MTQPRDASWDRVSRHRRLDSVLRGSPSQRWPRHVDCFVNLACQMAASIHCGTLSPASHAKWLLLEPRADSFRTLAGFSGKSSEHSRVLSRGRHQFSISAVAEIHSHLGAARLVWGRLAALAMPLWNRGPCSYVGPRKAPSGFGSRRRLGD